MLAARVTRIAQLPNLLAKPSENHPVDEQLREIKAHFRGYTCIQGYASSDQNIDDYLEAGDRLDDF